MRIEPYIEWSGHTLAPPGSRHAAATVWRIGLDIDASELDVAYESLATDEKIRADRFVFAIHRRRFVAARAALRQILGEQLAVKARDVAFRYTAEGKPEIANRSDRQFSVSHSGDLCLIAVARGVRVGIDIEATIPNDVQMEEVARSFHPEERQALDAIDQAFRQIAFYRCWVRKEAFLKALGVGLGGGLARFSVSLGNDARLLGSDETLATGANWRLVSLDGDGYAAAMAIECATQPAQASDESLQSVTPANSSAAPCSQS